MIADEHDVLEAGVLQAARDAFEHTLEHRFGNADCPREQHVACRRIDGALRHKRDNRRHQRIAHGARDALGRGGDDGVMLAEHHVRAVLLDAAGGHDDRGRAAIDGGFHVEPRHLAHVQARRRGIGCASLRRRRELNAEGGHGHHKPRSARHA